MAFAQVQRGRSFLSGGIGFNTSSPKNPAPGETKQFTHFDINAKYGFMIGNSWAIGISPSYSTQMQKYAAGGTRVGTDFGIGPFVRKYFALSDKFYFHLDASYSFDQIGSYSTDVNGNKIKDPKSTSNVIAISPGASYFITDRVALQAMLGSLAYTKYNGPATNASTGFVVNFGISSITLGAALYF